MAAATLKADLVRELQRALNGRGKGNQLPLAWAVGFQKRGTPDTHLVVFIPDNFPMTDAEIKEHARATIKSVRVIDPYKRVVYSTGEIRDGYEHRFSPTVIQADVVPATQESVEKAMSYLAKNAAQDPKRGALASEKDQKRIRTLEDRALSQVGDDASPTIKRQAYQKLAYTGRRMGTSHNWGAQMKESKQARQQYVALEALKDHGRDTTDSPSCTSKG